MVDYTKMVPMLQAISTTATTPVVRVPWLDAGILMKTADQDHSALVKALELLADHTVTPDQP